MLLPIVPMNWTLIPVCSSRLPSFGRTVTDPLTDSPSMYRGAFSRLFLSSRTSTDCLSSPSSRTTSISTGVEKKKEDMACGIWLGEAAEERTRGFQGREPFTAPTRLGNVGLSCELCSGFELEARPNSRGRDIQWKVRLRKQILKMEVRAQG
jgi:hypothetical protein